MRFVEENTRPAARMSTICCEASSERNHPVEHVRGIRVQGISYA